MPRLTLPLRFRVLFLCVLCASNAGCEGSDGGGGGRSGGDGDGDGDSSGGMQAVGDGDGDGDGDSATDTFARYAGTAPDRNMVSSGDVCDRLATIQCAGEQHCCTAPGRDFDTCKATMKQGCIQDLYLDAVSADPVSGFDAGRAATAFTEYERQASTCDAGVAAWGAGNEGLRSMLVGTANAGGNCQPSGTIPSEAQVAAALTSCKDGAGQACQPRGLTPVTIMWRCEGRTAAGGDCFTDANCQDGLYCDNPDLADLVASCVPRLAEGSACGTPNECASLMCKGGTCVAADQQAVYCLDNG